MSSLDIYSHAWREGSTPVNRKILFPHAQGWIKRRVSLGKMVVLNFTFNFLSCNLLASYFWNYIPFWHHYSCSFMCCLVFCWSKPLIDLDSQFLEHNLESSVQEVGSPFLSFSSAQPDYPQTVPEQGHDIWGDLHTFVGWEGCQVWSNTTFVVYITGVKNFKFQMRWYLITFWYHK